MKVKTTPCLLHHMYVSGFLAKACGREEETERLTPHHHLVLRTRAQILNSYVFLHILFMHIGLLAFQLVQ